jgi:nucleotidyltransferase/DNA polymerase involved in DNA repair
MEARPAVYQRRFEAIVAAAERLSPVVEPGPLGVVYADLRGLEGLFPRPGDLSRAFLACAPAAFHPQVGIGPGKLPALVAAYRAGPDRTYILPRKRVGAALAGVSVRHLPVDEEVKRRLQRLGLDTLGSLAALPKGAVMAQFGPLGGRMWELAHGRDPDPVRPRSAGEVITAQLTLEAPLVTREAIVATAAQLAGQAVQTLAQRPRVTRQAVLRAVTERGQLWERTVTFKEAAGERERIWAAIKPLLEVAPFPGPLVELTVELRALAPAVGRQQPLWLEGRPRQQAQLEEALRQLKARYGTCPVGRVVEVDPCSRIPERRMALLAYDP